MIEIFIWYYDNKGKEYDFLGKYNEDIPSVAPSQKQQIKRFPPSINFMNEHMYALQRWHRMGPISPKLANGGSS